MFKPVEYIVNCLIDFMYGISALGRIILDVACLVGITILKILG